MKKLFVFVTVLIAFALFACSSTTVATALPVQPTLTPYPTQVPPTPYPTPVPPTAIPPTVVPSNDVDTVRINAIATLLENGFVRDSSLDSKCSTQCEGYSHNNQMGALVYDNGGFGIWAIVNSNSDATAQAQTVFYVVKAIYGANVVAFVANSFSDMNGTAGSKMATIDGFDVGVAIEYSNGSALMVVAVTPATSGSTNSSSS